MGQLCSFLGNDHLSALGRMIIRPPRAFYHLSELGPSEFQIANVSYERVDLQLINDRGLKLECSHYRPTGPGDDAATADADAAAGGRPSLVWPSAQKLPCVVYIHGHSSSRLEAQDAVHLLLPRNITVFCLDLAGSGLSEGEFVSLGHFEERDIKIVVDHLRNNPAIGEVGLWGRSMGAAIAVSCAAKDPQVAACVLDSGYSAFPTLAQELTTSRRGALNVPRLFYRTLYNFVRQEVQTHAGFDIEEVLPIRAAPEAKSPALFVVAKDDAAIPPHHTYDLHKAWGGNDKMLVTTDGGHGARRPKALMDFVGRFLQQRLSAPTKRDHAGKVSAPEQKSAKTPIVSRWRSKPSLPASATDDEVVASQPSTKLISIE